VAAAGSTGLRSHPVLAPVSRRFEHDVLRAMMQHVAPHFLESFPALDDLEEMISRELTDSACDE
jgi:hypothetical protein